MPSTPSFKSSLGLSFKRLDLHVHTPGSNCFSGTCTPEDVVKKAIEMGLDGIAITDHNTAKWVDKVKLAAEKTPLVVFPGVEISCGGGKKSIHIVALFDPSATGDDVNAVLNKLDINPPQYGQEEAVTGKGLLEVLKTIADGKGLPVLAHCNSSNGLLGDMTGQLRTLVIQSPYLFAAEATDFDDIQKQQNHRRVIDLLDGTDPTYRRKLAVYQASDNPSPKNDGHHSLEGIGTRFSYFKMERINLESLYQSFVDPDVRIRQENEISQIRYPYISQVSINSGFLSGATPSFHPGLTSILGAKGAGKSLLVEFIRFALNQEPSNESIYRDHLSKLKSRLGEFGRVEVTIVDQNGEPTVIGREFRELDGSPYDESVIPFDPSQVYPILFLSQNEIIAIAENETEQLEFIDRFFDFHSYKSRIAAIEKDLVQLDRLMAESLHAYSEAEELTGRIETLNKEISRLDEALKNPIFEKFVALEKKDKLLRMQQDHLRNYMENVSKTRDSITTIPIPSLPDSLQTDPAAKRNLAIIGKIRDATSEAFAGLIRELQSAYRQVDKEYLAWQVEFDAGKKEYEQKIQSMGGNYQSLALTRDKSTRQRSQLQSQLAEVTAKRDRVTSISKKRNDFLDELQTIYNDYSKQRKSKCVKFMDDSGGKLQLRILDESNVEKFQQSLLSLKRGSYLKDEEITLITSKVNPRDFVLALLRYHTLKEVKHLQQVSIDSSIDKSRMKQLADFLLNTIPYEELLSLQYKAYPQDRPEILFNIGSENYQSISNISVGQKCTAMLLMALSDGTMPIVIDQPEDSLDIRSIWEDVCKKVRGGKEKRQFIFTTHNSSVAVAADTDCYLVIEGDASRGKLVYVGAMDHHPLSLEVMKYLEGGPDTYQLKFNKYSGLKRS